MRKKHVLNRLLLTALLPVISSCFTTGKNFPSDIGWIKKSQTKKSDVNLMLGPPTSIGSSGGTNTWTYVFYKYHWWVGEVLHKELKFYWTKDHAVKHYSFDSSFPSDIEKAGIKPTKGSKKRSIPPKSEPAKPSKPVSLNKQEFEWY